jgi:hypothetical protein
MAAPVDNGKNLVTCSDFFDGVFGQSTEGEQTAFPVVQLRQNYPERLCPVVEREDKRDVMGFKSGASLPARQLCAASHTA